MYADFKISREPVAVATLPNTDLYIKIFEEWLRVFPKNNGTGLDMAIKPFGRTSVRPGNTLGNTAVGQTWWSVLAEWDSPADVATMRNTMAHMAEFMTKESKAVGKYLPYKFANDASRIQNVMASYGTENLARMKTVSRKFDRDQVFQTLQGGGWRISSA